MLSYRHAFHAGNHADVLKHFCLWRTLAYFNRKETPYWVIDTHAGAGCYDLRGEFAQKTGEYRHGFARLEAKAEASPAALSPLLQAFVAHIRAIRPEPHTYPGSPWLAASLLRAQDKLRLFELHPSDTPLLAAAMHKVLPAKRYQLAQEDGLAGLIRLLPPPPRRAVVLVDPPYENSREYRQIPQTLAAALKRFATGCYLIWYPCLSKPDSVRLPEVLQQLLPENYLRAELHVSAPAADGFGMFGSGMLVLNPPWPLYDELQAALPELTALLAQDEAARWVLQAKLR